MLIFDFSQLYNKPYDLIIQKDKDLKHLITKRINAEVKYIFENLIKKGKTGF